MPHDATPRPAGRRTYHHGDLREALVQGGLDLIAEAGLGGFSVAEVARRIGVSTAAPYRHFKDRDRLFAAVAAVAARELAAAMQEQVHGADPDPVSRFAATAGAYVRYASARRAGFSVIFAQGLERLRDPELGEAGRELMDLLRPLAQEAIDSDDPRSALDLLEQHIALAHGFASLFTDGFYARNGRTVDEIADKATRASRLLTGAWGSAIG